MRYDFTDEILILARTRMDAGQNPATQPSIEGACWVISRVAGREVADVLAEVDAAQRHIVSRSTQATISPLLSAGGARSVPQVVSAATMLGAPAPDPVLGYFNVPGGEAWPITYIGQEPPAADLSKPPAPPSDDSFAAMTERMIEEGNPALRPLTPEELAEVEADMERAREISGGQVVTEFPLVGSSPRPRVTRHD